MRAIEIMQETGPESALRAVEIEPPTVLRATDGSESEEAVLIEVAATGASFPELLQTRGLYQLRPQLPFVPGCEVSGIVVSAPESAFVRAGDRAVAFCKLGGWAELALAPAALTFPLHERLSFTEGAALMLNYHTAHFALAHRGRLKAGERLLVQGAAGGLGTAALQVGRALGAHTIALVSSEAKMEVAQRAGAHDVVLLSDAWRQDVQRLAQGGLDVVFDPVGGDRFTDNLRCLREDGRALVVGFTAGSIPEVKVNRLLLNNIEVVGVGWGAYIARRQALARQTATALDELIDAGDVKPLIGGEFPLEQASTALAILERREALGKLVLRVRA